ncbi:MAG: hypothetical protein EOO43_16895 [Flavobacterium sp.]|nr:MAG: hypothetical protein EOO43_16895 [Flavobacterium sp.]
MAKKFSELVAATMSPDAVQRAKKATQEMRDAMPLNELRQALEKWKMKRYIAYLILYCPNDGKGKLKSQEINFPYRA